ncbi:DNA repair protein [Wickerhamomyces ciferrii]|uniref:DNA repair protein n=1 Tax=Wickerhamomyces ciferrii (strain ATCC 14091 / BCRC 22168 / CBS 111 / JCM 3599 / NBRC 0793 / NRRL Y-1031 F-60-10) TaxID=1206466 RepID=K0KXN2_WICCF|nr:DNA repair protein [Wickerhamomyces ciferrii]CCH46229.1 DNA repair protein [Wickerhamomyces ciferrii]
MPGVPREYLGLMRDAIKDSSNSPSGQRPLKRRRRNRQNIPGQMGNDDVNGNSESQGSSLSEPITIDDSTPEVKEEGQSQVTPKASSNASPNPQSFIDLSDIDKTPEVAKIITLEESQERDTPDSNLEITVDDDGDNDDDDDEDDDDEDDFDDFEDVDLENVKPRASSNITGDININVNHKKDELQGKKKKKGKSKNVISREERLFRKDYHRNHIAIMAIHGFIRNKWCNNSTIHAYITKLITSKIYDELHPSKEIEMPQIRTRRFLDGLRHLLDKWSKYYKVTSNKGIIKHDWYDWYGYDKSKTPFERFAKCIAKGRGSRDIGAQGFVALLRAAGVPSRLVFSLQPPDVTCMAIKTKPEFGNNEQTTSKAPKSATEKLLELRKGKISESVDKPVKNIDIELDYPIFWAEAWDSASKIWITIDPVIFKIIENIKYRSKLEPPFSYPHNNLTYVIGYDRKGGVRDITKRYAEKYYAKTRKKRITKDEKEEIWYEDFLQTLSTRSANRADEYEDEYFNKKAISEGMPDNIQDFKNHPFYVLEGHLRSNEILHPKEHCGMIRTKGKNSSLKVYKRENVQTLRTPRAWYQKGRVLKTGERPMMVKQKTALQMKDDDDDPEERLYAIFQTSIYIPPPVQNGEITKNAYGNIDVYVDSMIPEGGVLIQKPFATDAAKMVGIDFAPAVVGFKFERRGATPKIDGILVAEEFKEAVEVVSEQLKVEAVEKQRIDLEIRALKGWGLLLAKLRIKHRLNTQHGKIDEDEDVNGNSEDEFARLEKEYENYLENDSSDDDDDGNGSEEGEEQKNHYEPGGFIVEAGQGGFEAPGGFIPDEGGFDKGDEYEESHGGGGFIQDEDEGYNSYDEQRNVSNRSHSEVQDSDGGFLIDDDDPTNSKSKFDEDDDEPYYGEGGFIVENEQPENEEHKEVTNEEPSNQVVENDENDEDIDEFEAFFDQLQNGEEDDDHESDENEKPDEENEQVFGNEKDDNEKDEIYNVKESENGNQNEPLQESVNEPAENFADGLIIEESNTPIQDAKNDVLENNATKPEKFSYEPNIINDSIIQESSEQSIPDPIPEEEEFENELDKEFNEQLRKEQELSKLKTSQESNSSKNIDEDNVEDFEFDYDSD